MDESKANTNMASSSSDDSNLNNMSLPAVENIKQEKLDFSCSTENVRQKHGQSMKDKSRSKRSYTKKQKLLENISIEKPPPKKRGRKSKKELLLMNKKAELAQEFQPSFKKSKIKSPLQQKSNKTSKKAATTKVRKSSNTSSGPSVFDKKILAGPHLTMKQVLEYILTDHSYCVPPDPLPAVGSNHQMIRYLLGPKNGAKAKSLPVMGMIESAERSPVSFSSLSRARVQLSVSSASPSTPSSKLENLLKRGDSSPINLGGSALRFSHSKHYENREESDADIDIVSVDPEEPEKRVAYDVEKAKEVMQECEKYVEFARGTDTGDNWEAKIVRTGWTKTQSSLFDKVVGALHAERLARLVYESAGDAEPVLRRASLDRTASRIRRIFGEYLWDTKLTQWLHSVLTEFLNFAYLAIYMDVLQTLKAQCPHLITRMMKLSIITPLQSAYGRDNELQELLTPFLGIENQQEQALAVSTDERSDEKHPLSMSTENETSNIEKSPESKTDESDIYLPAKSVAPQVEDAMIQLHSAKNAEAFKTLLERQWDPFSPDLFQRLKRLSSNPIFLVISPGVIFTKSSLYGRLKQYHRMFNRIGKTVKVRLSNREAMECTSPLTYLDKTIALAKEKIKRMRHCFPDRPLYLVGWGSGSVLAARLSITTGPVDGIIALAFPLHSLRETHDDVLKIFGGIKHPILFVIGGLASNNSLTDMELFRRRLACETSLVVVGSGNEHLYVGRDHREKLLITQSFVNKTVMDEVAYFVNLHSKHNQIIAANISMKPQFSKAHSASDTLNPKKPTSLLRGKKRKSSLSDLSSEAFPAGGESKDSCDSDIEKSNENYSCAVNSSVKREVDPMKPSMGPFDYGFDGPKFIPSNKSSSKRKAYYRPDPAPISSSITSSSCITASKLLQQSPNVKRRMSKPSGPTQRVPLLSQQSSQRSSAGQVVDAPKQEDPAALYKYLNTGGSQNENEQGQGQPKSSTNFPLVVRQNEGTISGGNDRAMGVPPYLGKEMTEKTSKKKISKSKSGKVSKISTSGSPASSIVSALSEVAAPPNTGATSTPPSSLDMHKFVVQHQQLLRQYEQTQQERPHSSQLFKLLSPGAQSSDNVDISSVASSVTANVSQGPSELVRLKLIGSQAGPSEVTGDTRTAMISKQNLVSNMSLPMIRLSRPGEENSQQPLFVTGASNPGSTILTNIASDSSEKIILRTSDKSVMKLNAADLKNLIAGGRGIQLFTGLPNQGPVNIIVKQPSESSEAETSTTATSASVGSTDSSSSVAVHQFSTAPIVLPVSDTVAELAAVQTPVIPNVEASSIITSSELSTPPEENKAEEAPTDPLMETDSVAMDVDPEEEMSGLLISSTFSVCPTSGERVLPPPPSVPCIDASVAVCAPEIEENANPLADLGVPANEEYLSVPIHIQAPTPVIPVVGESLDEATSENDGTLELQPSSEDSEEKNLIELKSSTAFYAEEMLEPKSETMLPSSHEISPDKVIAYPSTLPANLDVVSAAVPVLENHPSDSTIVENSSSDHATMYSVSKSVTDNDIVVSDSAVAVPETSEACSESKQDLKDSTNKEESFQSTANDDTSKFSSLEGEGTCLSSFTSDELLTVPIHVQSPNVSSVRKSSSSSKGKEISSEALSANEEKGNQESKSSSTAGSDGDKKKTKSRPVRRSARLKSGV